VLAVEAPWAEYTVSPLDVIPLTVIAPPTETMLPEYPRLMGPEPAPVLMLTGFPLFAEVFMLTTPDWPSVPLPVIAPAVSDAAVTLPLALIAAAVNVPVVVGEPASIMLPEPVELRGAPNPLDPLDVRN
jgi:hypothetical protein